MFTSKIVFRSAVWFAPAIVLNRVKYLLLTIVIARLGAFDMAVFYFALYLTDQLSVFANYLSASSYNRFLRDARVTIDNKKLSNVVSSALQASFFTSLILAIGLFLSSGFIASLFNIPEISEAFKILALGIIFLTLTNQLIQMLSILQKFREALLIHYVIEMALVLTMALVGIFIIHAGLIGVITLQVLAMVLSFLLAVIIFKTVFKNIVFNLKNVIPAGIKLSGVSIANSLFLMLFVHIDVFLVGIYFGVINLEKYIAIMIGPKLVYAVATEIFPMYVHTVANMGSDLDRISFLTKKVTFYILLLSMPLFILLTVFPQGFIRQILHLNIIVDPLVVRILSLAFLVKIFGWLGGQLLLGTKQNKVNLQINVMIMILTLPAFLLMIKPLGIFGVSLVLLSTSLMEAVIKNFVVAKRLGIKIL